MAPPIIAAAAPLLKGLVSKLLPSLLQGAAKQAGGQVAGQLVQNSPLGPHVQPQRQDQPPPASA